MFHLDAHRYPYLEEVNEGILRQFQADSAAAPAGFGEGRRVLDVGCGRGALGEAIRALGCEVWGVEQNEEAAEVARVRLDRLVEADLHDVDHVSEVVGDTRFDVVVLSDVLEHIYDPLLVLRRYLRFVRAGGRVMISVPNAVVWSNRLKWMLGRVEYEDSGVMDRTHIRFFTFRTARELAQEAGCRIERMDSTPYLVRALLPLVRRFVGGGDAYPNPRALLDSLPYRLYMRFLYPVERGLCSLWRTMLAFRIIVVATVPEPLLPAPPDHPLLTVAMITMNEEKAVEKVVRDIRAAVPEAEILLVDSSRDRTPEIAESLGARVIRQFPPRGYGPAMDTALHSASGRVVVTLDCDDTYPAELIPLLLQKVVEEGYDLVDGTRTWRKPEAMPWVNFVANVGFALVASLLFGRWILDLHSGMRAYRKSLIDDLRYDPRGAALPVELLLRPLRMGRRWTTVPIPYRPRLGDSTMRPLESAWWTLKRIWRARTS